MSYRTVVITNRCKCSYKNDYMVVFGDKTTLVHLSEIGTVIFDTTAVSITAYLMSELMKRKVCVIFCDESRNPQAQCLPLSGSHNSSGRVHKQVNWTTSSRELAWQIIIAGKLRNQSAVLFKLGREGYEQIMQFAQEVQLNDATNREGHAAKVYFHHLYGLGFVRGANDPINASLNYGYAILASSVSKEIVANGYITQLGLWHRSEYNHFNLTYDLVEIFRPIIDALVWDLAPEDFCYDVKLKLTDALNGQYLYRESQHYLTNIIRLYVKDALEAISNQTPERIDCLDLLCGIES